MKIAVYASYDPDLMTVNERIRQVRIHKKISSKELANNSGLSPAEISLIERQMRVPRIDTLQRIAAALEVSSAYLLSEFNADLPLPAALAKESLQIFLSENKLDSKEISKLRKIADKSSAPQSTRGWQDLVANLSAYHQVRKLHR